MGQETSRGLGTLQQGQAPLHPHQEVGQLADVGQLSLPGLDLRQSVQAGQLETVELWTALPPRLELILGKYNNNAWTTDIRVMKKQSGNKKYATILQSIPFIRRSEIG